MSRRVQNINNVWSFVKYDSAEAPVMLNLPHTYNGDDGQDGGDDYYRGKAIYKKELPNIDYNPENELVYLEFKGVNASADVLLNGTHLMHHDGGYSTFRVNITDYIKDSNTLEVITDNSVNDHVYPQKADFTFYGGIYRDVNLIIVNKTHFDLNYLGSKGIKITPTINDDGSAKIFVETFSNTENVRLEIIDGAGKVVCSATGVSHDFILSNPHLWDGLKDPYLYIARATIIENNVELDSVESTFGVRSFYVDPKKGFFLNGRSYPLRGVCRHQDRPHIGNALTHREHEEDIELIKEIGANTLRLAHYQHDDYFYDLCDRAGIVVWAEIPYISEHMVSIEADANTESQMKELIVQNYNHPSIVCWGISNEITIKVLSAPDMLLNHKKLNDLCHRMDPTRFTTLACYAMCMPFNAVAHITDVVSWNLYLGWYVPGLWLNDAWVGLFHLLYPNRALGYSEYGCEAMPNIHSEKPKRGDQSEEYQCIYHEYMLKFFDKHPHMWATHVWNMFDFAADARNQGGEPGMNHKGLVTFDRKTKKDAFYLYKAWWKSADEEPFVHICSQRFTERNTEKINLEVYSNEHTLNYFINGNWLAMQAGDKVFNLVVDMPKDAGDELKVEVKSEHAQDSATFIKLDKPNQSYVLSKEKANGGNWV